MMGHLLLTAIIAFLFLIPYALYMDQLEQNAHDRVLGEPGELAKPFPSLCPPVQVPEPVVFSAPRVQDLPALPFTGARLYQLWYDLFRHITERKRPKRIWRHIKRHHFHMYQQLKILKG